MSSSVAPSGLRRWQSRFLAVTTTAWAHTQDAFYGLVLGVPLGIVVMLAITPQKPVTTSDTPDSSKNASVPGPAPAVPDNTKSPQKPDSASPAPPVPPPSPFASASAAEKELVNRIVQHRFFRVRPTAEHVWDLAVKASNSRSNAIVSLDDKGRGEVATYSIDNALNNLLAPFDNPGKFAPPAEEHRCAQFSMAIYRTRPTPLVLLRKLLETIEVTDFQAP